MIVEATGVTAEGRISYGDTGIWDDAQIPGLRHIVDFLHSEGAAAGIQLGHAGRKASTPIAWRHGFDETEAEKPRVALRALGAHRPERDLARTGAMPSTRCRAR